MSFGGAGLYFGTMDSSNNSEGLESIKSTSSFERISEETEVEIRKYDIGEKIVSLSKESDYPYNWSAKDLGDKKSTFILAVDFAGFREAESRLVIVNSSKGAHIYQLQSEKIVKDVSGARLLSEVNQNEEKDEQKEVCRGSTVSFERASMADDAFSVEVSVTGEIARWIHVSIQLNGGSEEKDRIIEPSETSEFIFENIDKVEQVNEIVLTEDSADDCNTDKKITDIPLEK